MKFFKYLLFTLALGLVASSCNKEPLPWVTFEETEKGAFARLLETNGAPFLYTDFDNSVYTLTVEFYDENDGNDIEKMEWFARHRNNQAGTITDNVLYQGVASSQFGTDALSGLPTASFSLSAPEAAAAMGLSFDDFNPGDDIIFDGVITMKDGRTFGPDNTSASIQGSNGFDGIFRVVRPLLCPSELDGRCDVVTTVVSTGAGIFWDGTEGNVWEGECEFVGIGDGQYQVYTFHNGNRWLDVSVGAYFAAYESDIQSSLPNGGVYDPETMTVGSLEGDVVFVDACEIFSYTGSSKWGEVYAFSSLETNGPTLTFSWSNDYGEAATSVITRQDGSDWPPLRLP